MCLGFCRVEHSLKSTDPESPTEGPRTGEEEMPSCRGGAVGMKGGGEESGGEEWERYDSVM